MDFKNFTDELPEEFTGFTEEEPVEEATVGEFDYLKNITSAATGKPVRLGAVEFNSEIRNAFLSVAKENNALDAELAQKSAQQGNAPSVLASLENIRLRNMQVEGTYNNRIKELQEVAQAAAEKIIASSPKVVLNNTPEQLVQATETAKGAIAHNAVMDMVSKQAASKMGLAGSVAWAFTPMSLAENYNLAQYVNSIYGEDTVNTLTTFSHESMQKLKAYYSSLSDDEKTSFIDNTYKHFKDTWATTDTGAANIVMQMLEDEDPSTLEKVLSTIGGYAIPLAAAGTVFRVASGARTVGSAMKLASVEKQLAEVGAKDAVIAQASRNMGLVGAGQIVGGVTGVSDLIDTAKFVTMASAKVLPSSITTATSGMQDLIKSKVDSLVADLNTTIKAQNLREGEEVTLLKNIQERYNPAYNKEVHSFHPTSADGGAPTVLYKPANDTAFLTKEAAEEALKAKDPKGLLGMRVVPDTTNSGYRVPEAVLEARKARRDQLEVEYLKLNTQAGKVSQKATAMAKEVSAPQSLFDAKPKYKTFPLQFASDVDKAVYQLGSKTAASKSDPEVFAYVKEALGFKTDKGVQAFITNHRKSINDYLQKTTKGLASGDVRVPKFSATSADTPKAKAEAVNKKLEDVRKEIALLDEQIGAMSSANKGVVQGWLLEQRVDATPNYRNLGAYTQDDVNNMVRFSFGDWALGTSAELYANRLLGLHQSGRYQKLLTDFIRKPLEDLSNKQRIQLNDVLVNGDKQGKEFDDAVLSLMGLDEKTRIAYHSVRSLRNALYNLRNNAAVKSLTGKGFKQLAMPLTLDEPGVMFGRVVNPQETLVRSVYNTGKQEASSIDDAIKGQQLVYELWQPVSIGGKEYRHIAINPSVVKESPIAQVIPYRTGEFKRSYTDGYFIKVFSKKEIDGVVESRPTTHRTAATKTDADNYVKAFNEMVEAQNKGTLTLAKAAKMQAYGWKPEELMAELSTGKYGPDFKMEVLFNRTEDDYLESMRNTGGSGFSQYRGEHIKDVYGNDTNTLSPVDSLAAEISNTSFMVPVTEWRDVAIHRWYNTAKDALPVEAQNMPPEKAFYYMVNNKGTYAGNNQLNLFAQRVQDYVLNEVSVVTKEEEKFAANMRFMSEKLEGATGGALPITGAQLRMADAPTFLRAIAFHGFLGGGNPVQLVMQGLNAVNAAIISPVHGLKAAKNSVALRMALMSDREDVWRSIATAQKGATLGFTDADEFVETVKALRRSGLLDGINSTSMYGAETGKYGLFNKGTRVAGEASGFFFNRGEEISRIVSFDVARREFIAANKGVDWTTDAAMAKIIERQDDLTHNMTNANRASWQQGLMSIPTQFMQYPIKFTLNTFYSLTRSTNRAFTQGEAAALLLGHGLLFGVAGNLGNSLMFAQEAIGEAAESLDENQRLAIQQGVVAATINAIAVEITGDELQLAFGKRFGTLGSVNNAVGVTVDFLLGDAKALDFRDLLFGASGGALDRIFGNSAEAIKLFYHNKEEMTGAVAVEGLKLLATGGFSSLNNIQKAYIAEQNFNYVMSKSGTSLYHANENELAALRLGFNLNGEYEYSKLFKTAQDRKKHFADISKELGRLQVLALTAKRSGDMDAYKGYSNVIQTILNAHANPLERRQLLEQITKTWSGSKQRELLMQEITSMDKKTPLLVEDGKEMVR